jgi:hypothetical protein
MSQLLLPFPPALEHSPELAPLAILEVALQASEYALLAVCPEIVHGAAGGGRRGFTTVRANALILQARRLAAAISAYRDALERDARRADRECRRRPF